MIPDAQLVYDGDCPFCTAYVRHVRIRAALGALHLTDARDGGELVERIRAAGYDLDQGMVLILDGEMYHGDECLHRLALMSTRSGLFNRLNAWLFAHRRLARFSYPILRFGRNLALRLLGRSKIDAD